MLYYVAANLQGDVLALYNGAGVLKVTYEYDTWDNLINMVDNSGNNIGTLNPIRYRGYYFDEDTGLYYLQSRYYDPQVGRFINADAFVSTGQGLSGHNMFIYRGNNPVIYSDPTGEIAITTLIFVGSLIIGGAVALYSAYESRERGCNWVETFANAAIDGLCAFMTAYTCGIAGYECYYNMSMRYGYASNVTYMQPMEPIQGDCFSKSRKNSLVEKSLLIEKSASVETTKAYDENQQIVIEWAKDYQKTGISEADGIALVDLAKDCGLNYHYPMTHPLKSGYRSSVLHIKVANKHIKIVK